MSSESPPGSVTYHPHMRVRAFLAGRMTLLRGEATVEQQDLPGAMGRNVLAMLVLHRAPMRRADIAEALGREVVDDTFDASLNSTLSRLRTRLNVLGLDGREWLVATDGTIELRRVEPVDVDVESAIAACSNAEVAWRAGDIESAWSDATVAYSVACRPFLPNSQGLWAEHFQWVLDDVRRRALKIVVEAALASGDLHHAEIAARRLVRDDPLREDSHRLLIRAMLAAGDRARAKQALLDLSELLALELDVQPSTETLTLLA